jgi:RNase P subunit RPR2
LAHALPNKIAAPEKRNKKLDENLLQEKWYCAECTALLGIRQADEVTIRFKQEINLMVSGRILLVCRRCGTINRLDTHNRMNSN